MLAYFLLYSVDHDIAEEKDDESEVQLKLIHGYIFVCLRW